MMKNIYSKTTSSHESDDIILMTYDSYLVVQIDDLELRVRPIHPDGGSNIIDEENEKNIHIHHF